MDLIPPSWAFFLQPSMVTPILAVDLAPIGQGTLLHLGWLLPTSECSSIHFVLSSCLRHFEISRCYSRYISTTFTRKLQFRSDSGQPAWAWTTIHVLILGRSTPTMALAEWKPRRTLIDLYNERDHTRWYWRCAAMLSAFMIMTGYAPTYARKNESSNWTAIASSFSPLHSTTLAALLWIKIAQV